MTVATIGAMWGLWRHRRLSEDELRDLQNRKLRRIIQHAAERVPYYRALFARAGLSPEDVRTTDDLKAIPVSTKEDLTEAGFDERLADGADKQRCSVIRTSGSSGNPFSTYLNAHERMTRRLLGLRRLVDAGVRPWDRVCVLCNPVFMQSSRFRTSCVPVGLPAAEQIARLREVQPTVLKVWPSSLRVLMHQAGHSLGDVIHPRIVALSGEECSEELRRAIESDLKSEVFTFYAAGEFGPIASECRAHQGMHINADHLIVERVNDELVMTSLYGYTMPYIRYCLGDTGVLQEKVCSCGSSFPLLTSLQGRKNNIIQLPQGRTFSVTGVFSTALRPFPTLRRILLIQETLDHFVLEAVFLEPPTGEILSDMKRCVCECLGSGVTLDIRVVDAVREEGARKFCNFISRLSSVAEVDAQR